MVLGVPESASPSTWIQSDKFNSWPLLVWKYRDICKVKQVFGESTKYVDLEGADLCSWKLRICKTYNVLKKIEMFDLKKS